MDQSTPATLDPALIYRYTQALVDEERATEYRQGGFLCMQLKQDLDGRYQVLRKLGRGSFATVWLSYDKHESRWVSIKILRADQLSQSKELGRYMDIRKNLGSQNLSRAKIVHLINHFKHTSIHGDVHQCLVFELLGPSVHSYISQNVDLEIYPEYEDAEQILRMVVRMLEGIVALHKAGYAWGDPSPKNFAYTFPTQSLNRQQVLDAVGPVEETRLERLDGKSLGKWVPSCLVSSATFPDWPMDGYEDDFRILDLGSAFPLHSRRKNHPQPTFMQPPERIFDHEVGYETDLWGAGVLIHYFIFGACPPFWGIHETDRVQAMIDYVGPIPQRWHAKWKVMQKDMKQRKKVVPGSLLLERFANANHTAEVQALLPVIQGLMQIKPESRSSAKHALDSVVRICIGSADDELRELVPSKYQYD